MAQLNDLIVTGNSRFINKIYTSTADINCITASSAAGATEHSAGTTGQALVSDGDSIYWGDPQHADTADEAQHATSAATLDDTEFIEDNEPYLFRTAPSEAGNRVYEDAIVGGSVVWNQLVQNGDFSDGVTNWTVTGSSVTISASNNILTVEKTGTGSNGAKQVGDCLANHVYLCTADAKIVSGSVFSMRFMGTDTNITVSSESWQTVTNMIKMSSSQSNVNIVYLRYSSSNVGTANIRNVKIHDLTIMFGSTIADYIYSLEQATAGAGVAFFKALYPKDYYAYNAGGIESVKTSAKKVVGFNQFNDEVAMINAGFTKQSDGSWYISNPTGIDGKVAFENKSGYTGRINVVYDVKYASDAQGARFRVKYTDGSEANISVSAVDAVNQFKAVSRLTDESKIVSQIVFGHGSNIETWMRNICFSFLYDGERDGEYEAYVEHTYPLGNDELRGLFKLNNGKIYAEGDIKTSDGAIKRRYNILNLGELTWNKNQTGQFFADSIPFHPKAQTTNMLLSNGKYTISATGAYNPVVDRCISAQYSKIWITDSSITSGADLKTSLANVYLLVELNDPTTESADPYTNPQIVDNWGTEEFVDTREVPIPVGHESRYPKNDNYKLANIPAPPGGAGDYIVHTDEYGESVYQQASDIKVNYAGTADLGKRRIFIQGTQTTATTTGLWTGDASEYFNSASDLTDGQEITYWLPLPTTGNATLNLTFGDGTSSGAIDCYYGGTTRLTTHYGQGQAIHLTYRKNVKIPSTGSTTYTGWWADANYYSDSNTVSSLRGDYTYLVAGANVGVQNNSLIARDANGKYSSFTNNSTTATSKTANRTDYFDISKIFYYSGSVAAGGNMASGALYWAIAGINSRYTINASNLTVRKPLYLKFDVNESTVSSITGTKCYKLGGTANNDYWSQTLPTSADGMIYVEVSRGVRDYRVDLAEDQHYYRYTDKLHEYDSIGTIHSDVTTNIKGIGCVTTAADHADELVYSDALGYASTASGVCSFAAGINTLASGSASHTEGSSTTASGINSHAEGSNASATGAGTHAEGGDTKAIGACSHAEGAGTTASGLYSHSEGYLSFVGTGEIQGGIQMESTAAHAEGFQTTADKIASHSEGYYTIANGWYSHAEGCSCTASGTAAHAEGNGSRAYGHGSHAEGNSYVTQDGATAHAEGSGTTASGANSHAEGESTYTSPAANSSHVEGINSSVNLNSPSSAVHIEGVNCITGTTARGNVFGVHIEGHNNGLLADDKDPATRMGGATAVHIEGFESWANGHGAHVEGGYCFAKDVSHAEGYGSNAIGLNIGPSAHAEGDNTTADVSLATESGHAHAEGDSTYAYPPAGEHVTAHAEGYATSAIGSHTHAEGSNTLASGTDSHAEGNGTTASGNYSHAEGVGTLASYSRCHAEGGNTTASGSCSHAGGFYTIANQTAQTAIGKYNATVSDALFIVGKGTATNSRSNAMYVTTAGNINCVSLTQTSDERLKENIKPLTTTDVEILNVLQSKQFTLKQDETHQIHYGFIAQDVEQELNALGFATSSHSLIDIAQNEEGYYSLNYTELIPLLVQKVQALEARIAALENK